MENKKKKKNNEKKKVTAEERQKMRGKTLFWTYFAVYILVLFFAMHIGHIETIGSESSVSSGISNEGTLITYAIAALVNMMSRPFDILPFTIKHLQYMFIFSLIYGVFAYIQYLDYLRYKESRPGEEHGNSKWNEDVKGFAEQYTQQKDEPKERSLLDKIAGKEPAPQEETLDMNLLLTSQNKLSFDNKATKRNNNVIILGGSGTGKSFSYIKPNIAQANSSFVITDPSGEIYEDMNKFLKNMGYTVKVLNLKYYDRGNRYNPFDYIRRKEDGTCDPSSVMAMVSVFLDNAQGKGSKEEGFWRDSANALLCAACFYLIENRPYKDWTMANVSKLIRQAQKNESDSSSTTAFDLLMQQAGKDNPHSMAYSFYQTYKLAGDKTASSILVSTDVKLAKFSIEEVNTLTTTDLDDVENNINLNTIGDQRTAVFIITPTGGGPCDFLCSMFYNQLYDILYDRCESYYPTKFHIYSANGYPLETCFKSQEEAKDYIQSIMSSEIAEINQNDKTLYYLRTENGKLVTQRKPYLNPSIEKYYKTKHLCFESRKEAENYKKEYSNATVAKYGIRTPWAVTCLLDEFANIGEIPKFSEILATCRKYNINISVVLQNLAQLKGIYKDEWNSILGNCDNFLFLGSSELDTCKYVSEILGKATITTKSASRKSGEKGAANYSFSATGRELLNPTELVQMDNDLCIYVLRGEAPFKVPKIKFFEHRYFKKTGTGTDELKTTEAEMKQIFAKTTKKTRRKRKKTTILEKQKKMEPKPLNSGEDILDATETYSVKEAVETSKINMEEKTMTPIENLKAAAINDSSEMEDGTEEFLF